MRLGLVSYHIGHVVFSMLIYPLTHTHTYICMQLMLDLLDLRELQVYRVLPSNVSDRVLYNYQL